MRILFMGTPKFAVASLRRLVADGHQICGVFTQPDKPKNRGMKLTFSSVKEYALTENLAVSQPLKMKDGTALELVKELNPELIVVAAYGRILPEDILQFPRYGAINVHSSLLPKYRGAAPINWAILEGEAETGVTIMDMVKELDAGDIISQVKTPIDPQETAQELTVRLAELGAEALSAVIPTLADGSAVRIPQEASAHTYAPMLGRELSAIDWSRSSRQISDQIRGLIPWPCAATPLGGVNCKLFRAVPQGKTSAMAGAIVSADKSGIAVACGDGTALLITELQAEGGKRMSAADYLRGHPLPF